MSDALSPAEALSVYDAPKPFKSRTYVDRTSATTNRRNKSLKQILNQDRDAHLQRLGLLDKTKKKNEPKRRKTAADTGSAPESTEAPSSPAEDAAEPNTSVEAPPSLLPAKHYCDVTGLVGNYTDPKTRMRYHSAEIYEIIKGFAPGVDNSYLALRGNASQLM